MDDIPGFDAPWQAQLYALTQGVQAQGLFSAVEWSDALGAALDAARVHGPVDGGDGFWGAWQSALESLVAARSDVTAKSVDTGAEAWRDAFLNTPHGSPVRLSTD